MLAIFERTLKKETCIGLLVVGVISVFLLVYNSNEFTWNPVIVSHSILDAFNDNNISSKTMSLVVDTPTCKIPDLDPWDNDVKQTSKKCKIIDETGPKCDERMSHKWMYALGSTLIFNYSAVKASGYSMQSIRCCYSVILRVEQSLEQFDENADNLVKFTPCHYPISLSSVTIIKAEFIRAFCVSTSFPLFNDVVYREFFAFAQPDAAAQNKIISWRSVSDKNIIPPSVVILGLDTNSRLNSHRRLTQTLAELHKLDAVEFFGYTKVGENTLPNTAAFLGGMSEAEMMATCYPHEKGSFDACPFLWKEFDRAGFLTATVEESPLACMFNYLRNGFVVKPTNFYYRPFALAAVLRQEDQFMWFAKCIGRYTSVEILLKYLDDILRRGSNGAPVFIHSWLEVYSHECINSVRFEDATIAQFIQKLDKQNTILIFMSDHGDRYGAFRETTLGWYEDKLPSLWIYLPERVRHRYPEWQTNLKINARRLTSHFDLYHTFVQILHEYRLDSQFQVNTPNKTVGQSLLTPVPENRTCDSIGIPSSYCACAYPHAVVVNSSAVTAAVNAAILYLETQLPAECAKLSIQKVVSAKVMTLSESSQDYVVSFYTDPGGFLFEVTAKYFKAKGTTDKTTENNYRVESLSDILRMNKITREVNCVRNPVWERYCYCL